MILIRRDGITGNKVKDSKIGGDRKERSNCIIGIVIIYTQQPRRRSGGVSLGLT